MIFIIIFAQITPIWQLILNLDFNNLTFSLNFNNMKIIEYYYKNVTCKMIFPLLGCKNKETLLHSGLWSVFIGPRFVQFTMFTFTLMSSVESQLICRRFLELFVGVGSLQLENQVQG